MRQYSFTVYFVGADQMQVTAGSDSDAVIIAAAERIQQGKHTYAWQVVNHDTTQIRRLQSRNPLIINWE